MHRGRRDIMEIMKRRIVNLLTALSLMLCLTTLVLWARSYSVSDGFYRRWMTAADANQIQHRCYEIQWTRGQVRFLIRDDSVFHTGAMSNNAPKPKTQGGYFRDGPGHIGWETPPPQIIWNRLGFNAWKN